MIITFAAACLLLIGVALLLIAGISISRHSDSQKSQFAVNLGNIGAAQVVLGTIPFSYQAGTIVIGWAIITFLLVKTFVNKRILARLTKN